jgi:ADP-heptose:LPS heptosyltransferase
MHISAVHCTPTIGLFGATNWLRSAPFGPWSTVVYDKQYFKDNLPLEKNSMDINNKFYENIDIKEALIKLENYL